MDYNTSFMYRYTYTLEDTRVSWLKGKVNNSYDSRGSRKSTSRVTSMFTGWLGWSRSLVNVREDTGEAAGELNFSRLSTTSSNRELDTS